MPNRRPWTKLDDRTLKIHSKKKTPVAKVAKEMKRTKGALRQRGYVLGISLGHRRGGTLADAPRLFVHDKHRRR